ncbi:MAG: DUF3617 family protein [Caldimonas sp.]
MNRAALLLICLPVLAQAQTPALKLGAWETTSKSAMFPRPMVDNDCVKKADLEQFSKGPDKDEESCKPAKAPTVIGNKWTTDQTCADGRTVHAEFVAESPERVTGTIVSKSPKGGSAIRIDVSARWLGPSCKGLE